MTRIIPDSSASGLEWTRSSYSGGNNNCVEVAHGLVNVMPVRDSKVPAGPALVFADTTWSAFVDGVKAGTLV